MTIQSSDKLTYQCFEISLRQIIVVERSNFYFYLHSEILTLSSERSIAIFSVNILIQLIQINNNNKQASQASSPHQRSVKMFYSNNVQDIITRQKRQPARKDLKKPKASQPQITQFKIVHPNSILHVNK